MSKLVPIAETIKIYLDHCFKIEANYTLEKKLNWLTTNPLKNISENNWLNINNVYKNIVENKLDLDELILSSSYSDQNNLQSIDIWFGEPFNFMVEFDEKQHFNHFRGHTLFENQFVGDFDLYKKLCQKVAKSGTSGFQKIKENLLFPWMNDGDKQDNRIRQRAFRDFLKDILPLENSVNKTFRIPYTVTNKKIKDFDKDDLKNVLFYANSNKLYDNFK